MPKLHKRNLERNIIEIVKYLSRTESYPGELAKNINNGIKQFRRSSVPSYEDNPGLGTMPTRTKRIDCVSSIRISTVTARRIFNKYREFRHYEAIPENPDIKMRMTQELIDLLSRPTFDAGMRDSARNRFMTEVSRSNDMTMFDPRTVVTATGTRTFTPPLGSMSGVIVSNSINNMFISGTDTPISNNTSEAIG